MKFTLTLLILGTIRSELNFSNIEAVQDLSQNSDSNKFTNEASSLEKPEGINLRNLARRSNNYYNSYFDKDVEGEPVDSFDESDVYDEELDNGLESINTVNSPSRSESHCVAPNTPCNSGHRCTANGVAICDHGLWVNIPCGTGLKCGSSGGSYFCDWPNTQHVVQC